MAPIEYIGRYMRGWFDFAIADELHQLAGDTAQGNGLGVLGRVAQRLRAIGEDRWNLLQRNLEYHLEISDVADREGFDEVMGDGQLAITVICGGSGYLKIGPAVEALEAEAPGLGAAFYWTLTYALYRLMRVYNHDDALQYEERLQEYAEQDEDENKGQYEFPEVEKALPECIRLSLQKDNHDRWNLGARRLLRKHSNGRYRSWITRLRKLQQFSRIRVRPTYSFIEEGNYDGPPLPSLLVVFKERDAITACFDEEGQYMLEGTSEPAVGMAFHPQDSEEVRQALRVVERFVLFKVGDKSESVTADRDGSRGRTLTPEAIHEQAIYPNPGSTILRH